MEKYKTPPSLSLLKSDAEAALSRCAVDELPPRTSEELLHELQVHQIELEMQNENLRQAQIALEASRDQYVDLYEFAPVGYLTLSSVGQVLAINLTAATLLGEGRKKLLQRRFSSFVADDDRDTWHRFFSQALHVGGKWNCDITLRNSAGGTIAAGLNCLRTEGDGEVPMLRVAITDVTERQRAIEQRDLANQRLERLIAGQAAHLCTLASELTDAEQRERDRLHQLLHDEMQPLLVAARLKLSNVDSTSQPDVSARIAKEACEHISQVIQMARTLSLQLNPPQIRERGLVAALDSWSQWVKENYDLEVSLDSADDVEPEDIAIRQLCFNAVRELVMNAVKHAETARVNVTLRLLNRDTLRIAVVDGGNGFDPATISSGSGLATIERRIGMLGGTLKVDSERGRGTSVMLTIPRRPLVSPE